MKMIYLIGAAFVLISSLPILVARKKYAQSKDISQERDAWLRSSGFLIEYEANPRIFEMGVNVMLCIRDLPAEIWNIPAMHAGREPVVKISDQGHVYVESGFTVGAESRDEIFYAYSATCSRHIDVN